MTGSASPIRKTTPDIVLRSATPADARAIGRLHAASWRDAYRGILSDPFLDGPVTSDRERFWDRRFSQPRDDLIVVVAQSDEAVIGLAALVVAEDPRWGTLIDNLHILPQWRRRRIGGLVLREASRRIPNAEMERPVHLFVLERNASAQAAYRGWGGRPVERLVKLESDGESHRVLRYVWPDRAALLAGLG